MPHQINSHDVCVQGFERLRTNSEYILAIPVHSKMTPNEAYDALLDDLHAPDRGNDFDWDAADSAVRDFTESLKPFAFADIEDPTDPNDEPCYLFLYIEPIPNEPDAEGPHSVSAHERHGDNR